MRRIGWMLLAALCLLAWDARADVAPIPGCGGGVDADCSVETKEQDGTTCQSCFVVDGDRTACEAQFEGTEFVYVCTPTSGDYAASSYSEVWCDGPPASGCSLSPRCSVALPGLLVVVGLLVVAASTRRRRRG